MPQELPVHPVNVVMRQRKPSARITGAISIAVMAAAMSALRLERSIAVLPAGTFVMYLGRVSSVAHLVKTALATNVAHPGPKGELSAMMTLVVKVCVAALTIFVAKESVKMSALTVVQVPR